MINLKLKKKICSLLSVVCVSAIMLSLSSCGSKDSETQSSDVSITEETTTEETTTEETTIPEPSFEACPNAVVPLVKHDVMEVAGTYFESYDYYIQNTGDTAITDIEIAIMQFDKDFLPMSKEYVTQSMSINIPAGKMSYEGFGNPKDSYVEQAEYCVSTPISVTYRDGTEWKAENLDLWVDDVYKNYTLDMWKDAINSLKENAEKAENNEYLGNVKNINVYASAKGADVNFHTPNNYDKTMINKFSVYIIFYNKSGEYLNIQGFSVTQDAAETLDADQGGYPLYAQVNADNFGSAKSVIGEILYMDGTTWTNPYLDEWQCYNSIDTYRH